MNAVLPYGSFAGSLVLGVGFCVVSAYLPYPHCARIPSRGGTMDEKSRFLRILTQTIGIPQIITIIIGVPAMIVFLQSIWQALTFSHRVIAITSGCVLLAMVILFVYFQTRKRLYIIPDLLYKMHSIVHSHIINIKIAEMNEQDLLNWFSLIGIDTELTAIASSINDAAEIPSRLDALYSKHKDNDISDSDAEAIINYFLSKSNLPKMLEMDKEYKNIMMEINLMRLSIPNEEIALAVDGFIKDSELVNWLSIVCQIPADILPKILSPKLDAKLITMSKIIDSKVATSLAKVRESIRRYYKNG
jgi:hypothetical protein